MYRFALALILIIFSFNAANASGLMACCDRGISKEAAAKVPAMAKCHDMGSNKGHQAPEKQDTKKASQWLCANMCANKMVSTITTPEFKAVSFDLAASYGEHDIGLSVDRRPSTPPPKI